MLTQIVVSGLATGGTYALIALGFVIIWNTAAVVNFAQGEFAVVAMFVALTLFRFGHLPLFAALPAAVAASAALGWLVERIVIRPVIGKNAMTVVTVTIGLQIVLAEVAKLIFGGQPYPFPPLISGPPLLLGSVVLPRQSLLVIVAMAILVGVLHAMSVLTPFGKRLRAVAQDRDMAAMLGIDVHRTVALGFAVSAAVAGVAGVLLAPVIYISADLGLPLLIKSFVAAIIGGFGSYPGALAGGLLIGVIDNVVSYAVSTDYRDVVSFLVLIAMLLVRPQGLFPNHR